MPGRLVSLRIVINLFEKNKMKRFTFRLSFCKLRKTKKIYFFEG